MTLYKEFTNVDRIAGVRFKFIGNKIKIITHNHKLYPTHLLYDNIKKIINLTYFTSSAFAGTPPAFLFSVIHLLYIKKIIIVEWRMELAFYFLY